MSGRDPETLWERAPGSYFCTTIGAHIPVVQSLPQPTWYWMDYQANATTLGSANEGADTRGTTIEQQSME